MSKARWGIVSTGYIANRFADSLKHVEGAVIEAVASRSEDKARAFAEKYGIKKYYSSYEELSNNPDIDIVYIGTPNNFHLKDAFMFMEKGKNILCEKPLGVNEKQVRAMINKAEQTGVFFMEGMWTRFFPAIKKTLEWIKSGAIGQPRTFFANFGIDASSAGVWKLRRDMAGGAMMDVGIYPLALAFAAFGTDYSKIYSSARIENGVDVINTVTLEYPDGKIAVIASALAGMMENKVFISGTEGGIKIGESCEWWRADKAVLMKKGDDMFSFNGEIEVFEELYPSIGFQYEAKAVQDYVGKGAKQAVEMPWSDSIKIISTIDKLRAEWGVVFDED